MEIRVLGPLEVSAVTGGSIPLGGEKQRAVFAMLVLHLNRVVSNESLIEGLWGDKPPASATNMIQAYVSRLRKALLTQGDGIDRMLRRHGAGYVLEVDPEAIDLYRFHELIRKGGDLLPTEPVAAAAMLSDALDLWRGAPLAEFAAEPFSQIEIPRLQEQFLAAVALRVDADLDLGRHGELVGELEALVAEYPLHEGLRRRLMLSLYRSGRQAQALESYRRARQVFAEELGIDPSRDLQKLEQDILAQDPGLDWSIPEHTDAGVVSVGSAGIQPRTRVWNVPPRNPHFTGRTDLLETLHQRFNATPDILVVQTMYGLGGGGKSQLAIEYAHRSADANLIVWWIDAERTVLIPEQLVALAGKLGLPANGATADIVDRLMRYLGTRRDWLLVWDNAAHPADVADYRPTGAGQLLITSRNPGWGELGGRVEVDVMHRSDTIALLAKRIPGIDKNVAHMLANELGDLPLAAAQAAGYLEQTGLDPTDYLHRFRQRRAALLTKGNVLGYRGTVSTTWDLSLDQMQAHHPAAVSVLQQAAFLAPEPIPLRLFTQAPSLLAEPIRSAALADPDAIDDAVGAGVGFSLVRRHPGSFQQHRLLQTVIRAHLSAERQHQVAAQVMALLAAVHPGDPNDPTHWPAYSELAPHVLATTPLADEHPDARQLILATVSYLNVRGDPRAARRIGEDLLNRWQQILGRDHPDTLVAAATVTAGMSWLAEHDRARALGQDTLERSRRVLGLDHPVTLTVATHLTYALTWLGQETDARRLGEDSLDRARRVLGSDTPDTLRLAANLTFAFAWNGDIDQATALGLDTLTRCRATLTPDHPITLITEAHLALTRAWSGDVTADWLGSNDIWQRSRRALGADHPTTLGAAAHRALQLIVHGNPENAHTVAEETLRRCEHALGRDHLITMITAAVYAAACAHIGDARQALALAESVQERGYRSLGPDHIIVLIATWATISAMNSLGDHERARMIGQDGAARAARRFGPEHLITKLISLEIIR